MTQVKCNPYAMHYMQYAYCIKAKLEIYRYYMYLPLRRTRLVHYAFNGERRCTK